MSFKLKHIIFVLGLLMVIVSFLFFGRRMDLYIDFLLIGLAVSAISFLIILITKDSWKSKLLWGGVLIVAIVIQIFSEPLMINGSYRIYLNSHYKELNEIAVLLQNKPSDITVLNNEVTRGDSLLTLEERGKLESLSKKTGAFIISKSDEYIYFGLYGRLDEGGGASYWFGKVAPDKNRFTRLKGNWYY